MPKARPDGRYGHEPCLATAEMLEEIAVLRPLPMAIREALATVGVCQQHPEGEEIDVEPDERGVEVTAVISGTVRLSFRSVHGEDLPVLLLQGGDLCVLSDFATAGLDAPVARVLTPSAILCQLPYGPCMDAITRCQEAVRLHLDQQRVWLQELSGLVREQWHGPETRIRYALWRDTRNGRTVEYTHEKLALRARTTRPRVTTLGCVFECHSQSTMAAMVSMAR